MSTERESRIHNEILHHVDTRGVVDKDAAAAGASRRRRSHGRSRNSRFDRQIDLHGMTAEKAENCVRRTLRNGKARGRRSILVIHGQGLHSSADDGPVLKKLVQDLLANECRSLIRSWRPAMGPEGGAGATVVHL